MRTHKRGKDNMVKKIIATGIMIGMVLSFAACGNKASVGNNAMGTASEDMIGLFTWSFSAETLDIAIKVQHTEENTVFYCIIDKGNLFPEGPPFDTTGWEYYYGVKPPYDVKDAIIKSGDTLYCRVEQTANSAEQSFVEILLKVEDNIIGYAVIKISRRDDPAVNSATVLRSALIPKLRGEYQSVTEDEIKATIEKIKNN